MAKPVKQTPGFRRSASANKEQEKKRESMIGALRMNSIRGGMDGSKGSKPAGYGALDSASRSPASKAASRKFGEGKDPASADSPRARNMRNSNARRAVAASKKKK